MRTIKFRAWDNELGLMYAGTTLEKMLQDPPEWRDYYVWEQFTGLLDKNGVEIYEGDVVRIVSKMVKVDGSPTKDEDAINTYEIFYHPQHCEWFRRLLTTNKHYTIGYEEKVSYITLHYYEIIGNIHEEELK